MIHRGSLEYLIIIPSGAWDRLSCRWCITHRLFSSYIPLLAPSLHPSIHLEGLGDDPLPCGGWGGVGGCNAGPVRHGRPLPFSLLHLPPTPPATATRLTFDLIPA